MDLLGAILTTVAFISILGIIVAFSPTLVITELTILTRSKNAVLQTIAFIAGIALAVTLFCLVAMVFVEPSKQITLPSTRDVVSSVPILDVLIGIVLLVAAFRVLRPNPKPTAKSLGFKPEKLLSTKTLFWFGFIKMATSLSSIAAILLASRFIMTSVGTGTLQVASVLWLIAVTIFPFVLILLLKQYRPTSFAKIQNASDRAVNLNWRRVIAFVLAVVGCYFVLSGLVHFN
jgi:hypothetical protein